MGPARPSSHKAGTEEGFVERDEEGLVQALGQWWEQWVCSR